MGRFLAAAVVGLVTAVVNPAAGDKAPAKSPLPSASVTAPPKTGDAPPRCAADEVLCLVDPKRPRIQGCVKRTDPRHGCGSCAFHELETVFDARCDAGKVVYRCLVGHADRDGDKRNGCEAVVPYVRYGTLCTRNADCADGVFCNGEERCVPGAPDADGRGCAPSLSGTPCQSTQKCIEKMARCELNCVDEDGDGHMAATCGGDDCDDHDPRRYPGNAEVCDATDHDEDCDPMTFGRKDSDGDGFVDAACCNVGPDGKRNCGDDCNDANGSMHPGLSDACNGYDDDCNGIIDECRPNCPSSTPNYRYYDPYCVLLRTR